MRIAAVVVAVAVVVVHGAVEEAGSVVHARKIISKMVVIAVFGVAVVAAAVIGAVWALRIEAAQLMLGKVWLRGCRCRCCSTGAVKSVLGKVF